jgi:tetratricopeptide (TPR) repeat protein
MANLTERLAFLISANADQAIRAFQKTGNAADKDLGRAEDKIDKLSASFTKFGAGAMAFAGVAARGLFEFAQASEDAELQSRKLANSIANSSKMSDGAQQRFEDLAKSIQKVTTADGDAIVGAQALLVQFGLTEKQVTSLTPLVVDLSQKMGIDMETAGKAVAKSATGSTTALRKMGIIVDSTKNGGDAFTNTMEALAGSVGGFAEKEAETFSGKIERLKVSLEDLQEGIGSGVVDVFSGAISGATGLSDKLAEVDPNLQNAAGRFMGLATAGIGIAGALSFVAGQTIKMKDRFTDADGELTKFGKTAKTASIALAGFGALEIGAGIFNSITDNAGKTERSLQDLTIQAGLSSGDIVGSFRDMVTNISNRLDLMGDVFKGFGVDVEIAGQGAARNVEDIDEAFQKVLDTSPQVAQKLLDEWRAQTEALDHNSGAYQENIKEIEKYQGWVDLATGSAAALAGGIDGATGTVDEFGNVVGDANDELAEAIELTDEWQGRLAKFDKEAKLDDIAQQLGEIHESAVEAFGEPTQENIRQNREDVRELYEQVAEYLEELGNVPPEKQTQILALLDEGKFLEAFAALELLGKDITPIVYPKVERPKGFVGPLLEETAGYKPPVKPASMSADLWERFLAGLKFKAAGGPVNAGEPYVVGERGPEIMVPGASGTVVPNNKIGGSTVINVTVTSANPDDVIRAIQTYVRRNGQLPLATTTGVRY